MTWTKKLQKAFQIPPFTPLERHKTERVYTKVLRQGKAEDFSVKSKSAISFEDSKSYPDIEKKISQAYNRPE